MNMVLRKALPLVKQHLQAVFQASMDLSYFPKIFRDSTTVVIRKSAKPDYTRSKAYHPIALKCTLGKIFKSIIAEILSYLTETHRLLPDHYYQGRPGQSTEDALLVLSESIHRAWKNKKILSALFLEAFNNVYHKRLLHNLKMRQIPATIIALLESFLKNRWTRLLFSGVKSDTINTPTGIPQGSLLSPLLYMYYNADLLELPIKGDSKGTVSIGFIDDISHAVEGPTARSNVKRLEYMLQGSEVWRQKHGAQFERSKYILIHFTWNRR